MTFEPKGRSLSDFTVELDVYSGPYEWLLALILKDELEIFEVPLRELVESYFGSRDPGGREAAWNATRTSPARPRPSILLKSRTLSPALDAEAEGDEDEPLSPEELAERLTEYLKIRRAAERSARDLRLERWPLPVRPLRTPETRPAAHQSPTASPSPRGRRSRGLSSRPVGHLGPITVTLQELAGMIRAALASGPISYESLTRRHGPPEQGRRLRRRPLARPGGQPDARPDGTLGPPDPGAVGVRERTSAIPGPST